MNNNIAIFFNNPNRFLKQIKTVKQTINDLIDINKQLEQQLEEKFDSNKLLELNEIIPNIVVKRESNFTDILGMIYVSKKEIERVNSTFYYLLIRYISLLLLLNNIDNKEYHKLTTEIKKINPKIPINPPEVLQSIILKPTILIESSPTNFGHIDLVWKSNINFPEKAPIITPIKISDNLVQNTDVLYGGSYDSSGYDSTDNNINFIINDIFNKEDAIQKNIDKNELHPDKNKEYFELFRYGYKVLNKPNTTPNPTSTNALFIPNNILYDKTNIDSNLKSWVSKYLINVIRSILIFNYYFPDGNYRNYLDWYMFENFRKLPGDFDSLNIIKNLSDFRYYDFENEKIDGPQTFLNQFHNLLKTYETTSYDNSLERILFYFDLASRCYNNNGQLELRDKRGDFFVYKFKGPFIENVGMENEGHITNGYIGQQLRYISMRQRTYDWNGQKITRPNHLVFRDAHTNGIAYNDYLLIKEVNKMGRTNTPEFYLIPSSLSYSPPWNDTVKSIIDHKYYVKSPVAGQVQCVNFKPSDLFIEDNTYFKSIGMTFLVNNDEQLPIKIHRPYGKDLQNNLVSEYMYGIEEYTNASFFRLNEITSKSIYNSFNNCQKFLNFNNNEFSYLYSTVLFLLKYLHKKEQFTEISFYDFIKKVELLRNDISLKDNNLLGLLLAIFPTKYHWNISVYNHTQCLEKIKYDYFVSKMEQKLPERKDKAHLTNEITKENLRALNITCSKGALSSSIEWALRSYINKSDQKQDCEPTNYYSGFYFINPPSLNKGILRQPSDLKFSLDEIRKNNLKIRLNNTNYKLYPERDNFVRDVFKNIDSGKCHIKGTIQNIILKYGDNTDFGISQCETIAMKVSYLNPKGTGVSQSGVWVPLIWKALNYYGYDVNPECYQVKLKNNEDYETFNDLVKELSEIKGWAEYAAKILLHDNTRYKKADADFTSKTVSTKSEEYKNMPAEDHSQYKMNTYSKEFTPINHIRLQYQKDRTFINDNITQLLQKYKILDSDIETLQYIYDSTFSPIYHALSWKLLECVMEKTKTKDKFIFNDSGNVLAYYEYNVPQYPFDDDIDIGFITDDKYVEYKKFMKDCINSGFDIFVFEKIAENPNFKWYKPENTLRIDLKSISDVDKYNPENVWFIKVKMSYPKFIETAKKLGLTRFQLSDGELNVDAVPWIDVFPWFKESDNMYHIKFQEFHNFNPLSVELTNDVDAYGMKIKHPKNLLELVRNKYKKGNESKDEKDWNQYKKGGKIYNHTFNIRKDYKLKYDDIVNLVDEYVVNHNKEVKRIMDTISCDNMMGEIFQQPLPPKEVNNKYLSSGKLDSYKKYLKYKQKYMALKKFLNQ